MVYQPHLLRQNKKMKGSVYFDTASLLENDSLDFRKLTSENSNEGMTKDLVTRTYEWTCEIVTNQKQHTPNAIQTDVDKAFEGTKKLDLDGNH